MMVLGVTVEM
jgi:hypothetical protein